MDNIDMRGGFWNTLITLLAALGAVVLAVVTNSVTSYGIAAFMLLGFVVALVSLIHMALREREQLEARELEEIQAGATNEALFEEGEVLPAKRSREQFEKWGMPVVALAAWTNASADWVSSVPAKGTFPSRKIAAARSHIFSVSPGDMARNASRAAKSSTASLRMRAAGAKLISASGSPVTGSVIR